MLVGKYDIRIILVVMIKIMTPLFMMIMKKKKVFTVI